MSVPVVPEENPLPPVVDTLGSVEGDGTGASSYMPLVPDAASTMKSARWKRWVRLLRSFILGQAALQFVNFLAGFLLLRWLEKPAYAQFSAAFAFQSTVVMLTDLGFSNSIVALVGDRGEDPVVVGSYVRAAWSLRNKIFIVMTVITLVAFPIVTQRQPWSALERVLLLVSILASLFAQGWQMYQAPLIIRGQLDRLYLPQAGAGLWRIVASSSLYFLRALNGWVAALVNCIATIIVALSFRHAGRKLITEPSGSEPARQREMLRYLAPLMPGLLFTAFQGQLSLFLITYFGKGSSLAEVAALGRLGQVFVLLGAFNSVIIEPYFARLSADGLVRRYLQVLLAAIVASGVMCVLAALMPGPLLWILGAKYNNLRSIIPLLVAGACISYVAGVLWTMNAARRWIFWWYTYFYIGVVVASQIAGVLLFDISTTRGVMLFNLLTSVAVVVSHLCGGAYGLLKKRDNSGNHGGDV